MINTISQLNFFNDIKSEPFSIYCFPGPIIKYKYRPHNQLVIKREIFYKSAQTELK